MGTSINTLINDAIKYGSTLPTALKPLAEQLAKTGQLTDDAGGKLDDLSGLKFDDAGDPLAKGMSTLTDAINHLGTILSGLPGTADTAAAGIGAALSKVQAPTFDVHYRYVADNAPDTSFAAMGGLVTAHGVQYLDMGGFIPRGTDTVPAMLTPGEGVVNRTGMARLGQAGLRDLNRGGGGPASGDVRALHQELVGLRADLKRANDLMDSTLRTLPKQIRDAMQLARY